MSPPHVSLPMCPLLHPPYMPPPCVPSYTSLYVPSPCVPSHVSPSTPSLYVPAQHTLYTSLSISKPTSIGTCVDLKWSVCHVGGFCHVPILFPSPMCGGRRHRAPNIKVPPFMTTATKLKLTCSLHALSFPPHGFMPCHELPPRGSLPHVLPGMQMMHLHPPQPCDQQRSFGGRPDQWTTEGLGLSVCVCCKDWVLLCMLYVCVYVCVCVSKSFIEFFILEDSVIFSSINSQNDLKLLQV